MDRASSPSSWPADRRDSATAQTKRADSLTREPGRDRVFIAIGVTIDITDLGAGDYGRGIPLADSRIRGKNFATGPCVPAAWRDRGAVIYGAASGAPVRSSRRVRGSWRGRGCTRIYANRVVVVAFGRRPRVRRFVRDRKAWSAMRGSRRAARNSRRSRAAWPPLAMPSTRYVAGIASSSRFRRRRGDRDRWHRAGAGRCYTVRVPSPAPALMEARVLQNWRRRSERPFTSYGMSSHERPPSMRATADRGFPCMRYGRRPGLTRRTVPRFSARSPACAAPDEHAAEPST